MNRNAGIHDVLILAECSPEFGMGHLSRQLVLAQALAKRGASVRFALTSPHGLAHTGDFPAALAAEAAPTDGLLIVDGWRIGAETIAPFAAKARRTVLIDDTADRPRPGNVLVNFQLYAKDCDYSAYPARTRLLGPEYAPIRPGFAALRAHNQRSEPRVLMSFGGGATGALGFAAARALAARFSGPVDLALGALGPAPDAALPALPGNVSVHRGADMVVLMARATLYVGGLGTSFLEALTAGLPCVGVIAAPDQARAAKAARALGLRVLETPDADAIAEAALAAMADPAPPPLPLYPDGLGAARLADALLAADSG